MYCQVTGANIGDIRTSAVRPVRGAEGTQTDCKDSDVSPNFNIPIVSNMG